MQKFKDNIKITLKRDPILMVLFGENDKHLDIIKSRHYLDRSLSFEWGFSGAGPGQLAFAICLEIYHNPIFVDRIYSEFCRMYVKQWSQKTEDQLFYIDLSSFNRWIDDNFSFHNINAEFIGVPMQSLILTEYEGGLTTYTCQFIQLPVWKNEGITPELGIRSTAYHNLKSMQSIVGFHPVDCTTYEVLWI